MNGTTNDYNFTESVAKEIDVGKFDVETLKLEGREHKNTALFMLKDGENAADLLDDHVTVHID